MSPRVLSVSTCGRPATSKNSRVTAVFWLCLCRYSVLVHVIPYVLLTRTQLLVPVLNTRTRTYILLSGSVQKILTTTCRAITKSLSLHYNGCHFLGEVKVVLFLFPKSSNLIVCGNPLLCASSATTTCASCQTVCVLFKYL